MSINGIEMIFSKDKMIERLTCEGNAGAITDEIISIMDNLDGQPVSTSSWNRQVNDAFVYACQGKDGKSYDVNESDCI